MQNDRIYDMEIWHRLELEPAQWYADSLYLDMGTSGKHGQQQQQGPVLIQKGLPENFSKKALLPPNSSINRSKIL